MQKAESRHIKATADYQYRATVEAHPEMQKGGAVSRYIQKQKIKRQYAKQAREAAKQTAKAAEKTAVTTEKLAARAVAFVKRHPVGVLLFLACFLLLVLMQSCMSSAVTIGNGVVGAIGASTYAAEDADLRGAEAAYCGLEAELQDYLDSYESTHDYDEYHFELDDIEHDPYVLLSIISAIHEGAWTVDEVQGTLQMLFEKQYILTETVVTERRYYLETDTWTDEEGKSPLFQELLACCDRVYVQSEKSNRQCYHERNRYMVLSSDRVIAVYDGRSTGGTFYTIRFAQANEKEIRIIEI